MHTNHDLLHKIHRVELLLHRYTGACFRAYGPLGNPARGQGRVLSLLQMQPQIGQKELGYLLDMRQQSLSELLFKLEERGLITRSPSPADKRAVQITLTEAGKRYAAQDDAQSAVTDSLFDCLSAQECTTLADYLDKLAESLEQKLVEVLPGGARGGRGRARRGDCAPHRHDCRTPGAGMHGHRFAWREAMHPTQTDDSAAPHDANPPAPQDEQGQ